VGNGVPTFLLVYGVDTTIIAAFDKKGAADCHKWKQTIKWDVSGGNRNDPTVMAFYALAKAEASDHPGKPFYQHQKVEGNTLVLRDQPGLDVWGRQVVKADIKESKKDGLVLSKPTIPEAAQQGLYKTLEGLQVKVTLNSSLYQTVPDEAYRGTWTWGFTVTFAKKQNIYGPVVNVLKSVWTAA
jgi:hypothetical protein